MITLVDSAGRTSAVELDPGPAFTRPITPLTSRTIYAAAHVVPRTTAENVPGAPADLDWEATLAFRHHLWSWGLGVADAMDTAQRNMGLDSAATRELISRSAAEAALVGGGLVVGVTTDHVDDTAIPLSAVVDAYKEQLHFAEDAGASVVLMASRHLARTAGSAEDYERVYAEILAAAGAPVILHWLGSAFDPELGSYFGSAETDTASSTLLKIIANAPEKVAGVKMSLLDADAERAVRAQLPTPTRMFTGDDFNYVSLIGGDSSGHSEALLGAFAALGPHASAAIQALDADDRDAYAQILGPTEALSRQIFGSPTYYYKAGVAFLSWLNGHQPGVGMVGGLHATRSLPHLSEIVRLANACGALEQPELARKRWHSLLRVSGVDA
ncbi:DUF993 family protein [Arthrobacter sp. TMS2-4]